MADKETEDGQEILGKSYLFPIVTGNIDEKSSENKLTQLFPSVSLNYSQKKESLDWLSNKSYRCVSDTKSNETASKLFGEDEEQHLEYDSNESLSSDERDSNKKIKVQKIGLKHEKKHGKKQKVKKHKKHKHKKQKYEKIRSKAEEKLYKLPSTIWIEESGLDTENAFRIDKKPDKDNISFGGLYRLDIALYKVNPKLNWLGIKPGWINSKNRKKLSKESQERYWVNNGLVSFDDIPQTIYNANKKVSFGFSENFSYVPLQLPSSVIEKNKNDEILSIEIKDKASNELLFKTKSLNQKVRENPSDIKAWLALADIQGKQVQYGESSADSFTKAGLEKHKKLNKLKLEKKAAVLEQAIEKNPSSVEIILKYMDISVETMSSEEVIKNWQNILFTLPQKTILWKHYLLFCQANFSTFTFSNTLAAYSKCFNTLSGIKDGIFKSHSPEEEVEARMVEIFVQFCQFLRQAGHTEKAVAAFQALIELNCFFPKCLGEDVTTSEAVSIFENFWDSDLPRFGESNAAGWESFIENKLPNNDISVSDIFFADANQAVKPSDEQEILTANLEKSLMWLSLEMFRETDQWQPRKSSDDDVDDPDRIVLFQDISSFLFKISHDTLKYQLICYFLIFLGVPINNYCGCDSHHLGLKNLIQVILEDERQLGNCGSENGCGFSCWWTQFERKENDTICNWNCAPRLRMLIRNAFCQALEVFSGELQSMLVYHWLKFENSVLLKAETKQSKQCYKSARKLAKSLLKLEQYCNDLRLWMAFVQIEWSFGSRDEARRIVSSTLQQTQIVASSDRNLNTMRYSFVRQYCELEMGLHDARVQEPDRVNLVSDKIKNNILESIAFVTGALSSFGSVITPGQTLKINKTLQEMSSKILTQGHRWDVVNAEERGGQLVVNFNICYALFEYWSLGIDGAASVLDSLLSAITRGDSRCLSGSKYHEEILVFYCRLLQFHSKHHICPVRRLRELLLIALEIFQENPFFLHSYVMLELRSHVAISIRRFFDRILPTSHTPVPWLFAILYEKRRRDGILSVTGKAPELFSKDIKNTSQVVTILPVSGVINRMRSLYEKAISHPSTRHCVALWRSYINFEIENGNFHEAKAIFYQSLQCCAWAKVMYVDSVRLFPDTYQDFHDMMEEKELRIRAPFDELELLLET